jgi:hypothetical protein
MLLTERNEKLCVSKVSSAMIGIDTTFARPKRWYGLTALCHPTLMIAVDIIRCIVVKELGSASKHLARP